MLFWASFGAHNVTSREETSLHKEHLKKSTLKLSSYLLNTESTVCKENDFSKYDNDLSRGLTRLSVFRRRKNLTKCAKYYFNFKKYFHPFFHYDFLQLFREDTHILYTINWIEDSFNYSESEISLPSFSNYTRFLLTVS